MKHFIAAIFLVGAACPGTANCQTDQSRKSGDTLFTSVGYPIIAGQDIKLGTGGMPDGNFKFIRINSASLFQYTSSNGNQNAANSANALNRRASGLNYKVRRIESRGDKRHGFVYYAIIGDGLTKYEVDVENAIAAGEIKVPDQYAPKVKPAIVEAKQELSVADELAKLKKLKDEGILTSEEFDAQKAKLLSK